jgi:hypothetical protein
VAACPNKYSAVEKKAFSEEYWMYNVLQKLATFILVILPGTLINPKIIS